VVSRTTSTGDSLAARLAQSPVLGRFALAVDLYERRAEPMLKRTLVRYRPSWQSRSVVLLGGTRPG